MWRRSCHVCTESSITIFSGFHLIGIRQTTYRERRGGAGIQWPWRTTGHEAQRAVRGRCRARRAHRRRRPGRLRAAHAPAQHGAFSGCASDRSRRRRRRGRAPGGLPLRVPALARIPRRRAPVDLAHAHRHQPGARAAARASSRQRRRIARRPPARQRRTDGAGDGRRPASSPEAGAMRAELRRLLEKKIDALPLAFRTAFILREVEEMTIEEAAECLADPASDGAHARVPRPGDAARIRSPRKWTWRPPTSSPSPARAATASSPACSSGCACSTPRAGDGAFLIEPGAGGNSGACAVIQWVASTQSRRTRP